MLSALGGRKKTRDVECSSCNEAFGNNIDKVVADQVAILRNMLHLESGTGNLPRRLRKVDASGDTVDIEGDGTIKPVVKPITLTSLGEGKFDINVTAGSFEEIAKYIPHIAAKLKWSEEQVLQRLTTADAKIVSKRPGPIRHDFTFGGPLAIRSFVKSALVLWSTLVGTDEVKSATYEAARILVVQGDDGFVMDRVRLDSRPLPQVDELKRRFGDFFNLIYVQSDEAGRVLGHFTLYNTWAWHFILAERDGAPNLKIGLISNPTEPAIWSDTIADQIDIDIDAAWESSANYPEDFAHPCQQLGTAIERAQRNGMSKEVGKIARDVFEKLGVAEGTAVTDPATLRAFVGEFSSRFALHVMGIPREESILGDELVTRLRAARDNQTDE